MSRRAAMLAVSLALAGAPAAFAQDAPVATAAPTPTVAEQIDAYLKSSPALSLPDDGIDGVVSRRPERRPHGEVAISVGTGGYRSVYARTDLPVGRTGMVSIAVADTRFDRGFGPGDAGPCPRGPDWRVGHGAAGRSPEACRTSPFE